MITSWRRGCLLGVSAAFGLLVSLGVDAAESPPQEVMSKMHLLYGSASVAMREGNFAEARDTHLLLLQLLEEHPIDKRTVLELRIALADIYRKLGDDINEQKELSKLIALEPSGNELAQIAHLQARLYDKCGKKFEAFAVLKTLEEQVPLSQWTEEEMAYGASIRNALNQEYRKTLSQAERLFEAGLYVESVPLYREVLEATRRGGYPEASFPTMETSNIALQVRFRLGQAYYLGERYADAIDLLDKPEPFNLDQIRNPSPKLREIERNEMFLLGLCYRRNGQYEQAINTYRSYLQLGAECLVDNLDDVHWEVGICYYLLGKNLQARPIFESLCNKHTKEPCRTLAKLYLVRMSMNEGNTREAEVSLAEIERELDPQDHYQREVAFLRGEIAFRLRDYGKASEYFEKAIPSRLHNHLEWYAEALYHLGWSYLKIADDPLKGKQAQEKYFSGAVDSFQRLLNEKRGDAPFRERVTLALAQTHLRRGLRLKEEHYDGVIEDLLAPEGRFQSLDTQAQALVLRAEVAPKYEQRQQLYGILTGEHFLSSTLYGQGWYLRGLNEFAEAHARIKNGESPQAAPLIDDCILCFTQAFSILKDADKGSAALCIKYQAQAWELHATDDAHLQAFSLLHGLCQQHHDLLMALADPSEVYYLRGIIASKLAATRALAKETADEGSKFQDIAEESMLQVIANYPDGNYSRPALQFLGTLYFGQRKLLQSQQMFLKLAVDYPKSSEAGDAFFWASRCAEELSQSTEVIQGYRRTAYEQYPECMHAGEAYFTCFHYNDYLQGVPAAIEHLQALKEKFPTSPYVVSAQYLVGLDSRKQDLTLAAAAFDSAVKAYDQCLSEGRIPIDLLPYFTIIRYHSMLEHAKTYLAIAEGASGAKKLVYFEYAERALGNLAAELATADHEKTAPLKGTKALFELCEESLYGLAQIYIKSCNMPAAEHALSKLLDLYHENQQTTGYFLSRALYDLAHIEMQQGHYADALCFLSQSEEAAAGGFLSPEQRLDLWIESSHCLRSLKDLDKAMSMLSKVINDNTASALRLKAMYLRAEIYEQQGRHDLAVKQLEATAKQEGDWAVKAKERLEHDYGIR